MLHAGKGTDRRHEKVKVSDCSVTLKAGLYLILGILFHHCGESLYDK